MPVPMRQRELDNIIGLAILSLKQRKGEIIEKPLPPPDTVYDWSVRHRRIEGLPFSLERFLPLKALYADEHPHIVVIKPAQRGVSEYAINFTSFALEHGARVWTDGQKDGVNVAYIFPTIDTLGDFSKERISGLEEETVHLARLFGEHDDYNAVRFKQVGRSYLYLRGGWSPRALKSFPADILILDEYDEMDPKAIALARRRMNASIVHRELDISTPTIPGFGIHEVYLRSDQRVYRQRHRCGEWVGYDFYKNVVVNGQAWAEGDGGWRYLMAEELLTATVELICPSCGGAVTEEERMALGEWSAMAPLAKAVRGYHIPWWPFPIVDLTRFAIAAVSRDPTEVEQFNQQDLGNPYSASGARVTAEGLLNCSIDLENGELPPNAVYTKVTMGVDVGTRLHIRVSGELNSIPHVLWMGAVLEFEELYDIMDRFKVRLCVIDAMPEQHAVSAFVARFPGRVIAAGYPTNVQALKAALVGPNKEGKPNVDLIMDNKRVQVNRTMAMDRVSANIANQKERWPRSIATMPEVVGNMTSPVRVVIQDKTGQPTASWVHTTPDHFFHACVYDLVARELCRPEAASASTPTTVKHDYHAARRRML